MKCNRFITSAVLALCGFGPACSCGDPLIVYDPFQTDTAPVADALHTYASNAQVPLKVRSNSAFENIDDVADPKASGAIALDANTKVDRTDGVLSFAVLTSDAGTGTLTLTDKNGSTIITRSLDVVDVDAMALAVTAPITDGINLPVVDLTKVRIYAGGKAALRTTLTKGGDEIMGLHAVVATPADATLTTRNGSGCAVDTCEAARNAVEISVPAATTDESDVALSAGTATATVHVVPTADADITDLVFEQAKTNDGKGDLYAHVLAGAETVLGAPVAWQVDGAALQNDDGTPKQGDALQFDVAPNNTNPNVHAAAHDVTATIATQTAQSNITGANFTVTSITSACGATSSSTATLAVLALGLFVARRRRAR